jgi:hypothetical protein
VLFPALPCPAQWRARHVKVMYDGKAAVIASDESGGSVEILMLDADNKPDQTQQYACPTPPPASLVLFSHRTPGLGGGQHYPRLRLRLCSPALWGSVLADVGCWLVLLSCGSCIIHRRRLFTAGALSPRVKLSA